MIAAGVLALLLAGGAALAPGLGGRPVPATLVDPHDPAVVLDREITQTFGLARPVVWIVEARAGSIWTPAMLARVQAITRDVFRIPGVVAPDVLGIASPNLRDLEVSAEGMRPTYLMGAVPETPEAVAKLRARVDGDPLLRGQLVDVAGRAAMIVANFRADADAAEIARGARALRDRHADAEVAVWVVGEPVLAAGVAAAAPSLVLGRVAPIVAVALVVAGVLLGWRGAVAALVAAAATGLGTAAFAAWADALVLPWTVLAGVAGLLAAAGLAAAARIEWRAACGAVLATGLALGVCAVLAPGAERALAWGGLVALPLGLGAGLLAREALAVPDRSRHATYGRSRAAALLVLAVLTAGAVRLGPGFALASYAERYLPGALASDVEALSRLFPPPQSLALRARGEPGFVASPDVLRALAHVAEAAAADPRVRHAMSLADLVKIVHRSFNEGRPEYAVLPEDRGLIARYLALAYSPGFRRFVDRSLGSTALWITIDQAAPRDLRRIARRVERALAERPVPDAVVDRFGGDGAVTLAMAACGRRLAIGGAGVLALALVGVGVGAGRVAAFRALVAAALATAVSAGLLGWLGQALDLVTIPLLFGVALAAVVSAGRGR